MGKITYKNQLYDISEQSYAQLKKFASPKKTAEDEIVTDIAKDLLLGSPVHQRQLEKSQRGTDNPEQDRLYREAADLTQAIKTVGKKLDSSGLQDIQMKARFMEEHPHSHEYDADPDISMFTLGKPERAEAHKLIDIAEHIEFVDDIEDALTPLDDQARIEKVQVGFFDGLKSFFEGIALWLSSLFRKSK